MLNFWCAESVFVTCNKKSILTLLWLCIVGLRMDAFRAPGMSSSACVSVTSGLAMTGTDRPTVPWVRSMRSSVFSLPRQPGNLLTVESRSADLTHVTNNLQCEGQAILSMTI